MKKRFTKLTGHRPVRPDLIFEEKESGVRHHVGEFDGLAVLCGAVATTEHYEPLRGSCVPTCLLCIAQARL